MNYYEVQKAVFDFLYKKHNSNPNFTFSVRRKASKGAEKNYFIGTEKSHYFSFTLWAIPCWYRGASTEVISYIIKPEEERFILYLEYFMARNQRENQNQYNIEFGKILENRMKEKGWECTPSPPENKMYTFWFGYPKKIITVDDLVKSIDDFIDKTQPIIQEAIDVTKIKFPQWNAERIDENTFNENITKLKSKMERYATLQPNNEGNSVINNKHNNARPEYNDSVNFILYGPPGTGKTYKTIIKAAEIVEGHEIEDYGEALDIFNKKLHDQIEFITFHQNYSYEDFVQGLRPDTDNDRELTFQKRDGIFKILSERALKNLKESENPSIARLEFDKVFYSYIEPLSEGAEIEVKMKKTLFHITQISDKSIEFRKNKGDSQHTLSINTLRHMYNKGANDIILGGLQPYYNPILDMLLEKGKTKVATIQKKNYVLIIDEINRANISRVFGELITLIEPDKRSHGKTPIEVKLPSGDLFIVPSNLYIIGTMNTADKSIALLDIALRRRFVFEAMYPEYEISGCEIFDVDVLQKINEQIVKSKGHDFQIGHAYFMDNSDNLVERMNQKVIPLLLEYYMNDEKEVKKILNGAGMEVIEDSWPIRISGKHD